MRTIFPLSSLLAHKRMGVVGVMQRITLLTLATLPLALSQQIGSVKEIHPTLQTQTCTIDGGCTTHETKLVLDALTHPIYDIGTGQSCIHPQTGALDEKICPTVEECAKNCALDGTNYHNHGVVAEGDSLTLHMYLRVGNQLRTTSPRLYLLDENLEEYTMLKLLGQELSFDVDMSKLPCGMNSALYLSEMESTGGRSQLNPAGATLGTGYCDAQCFNTSAFINGVANIKPFGACCNEMDVWEANARATALTPHSCTKPGLSECTGNQCGVNGTCDKTGCSYNPYRGAENYYGWNKVVNTLEPFTVTTQFVTDDGTTQGTLTQIRRLYVQNGKVIQNAAVEFKKSTIDSITEPYCNDVADSFVERGGLKTMGQALGRGMVLIFSLWNDASAFMNWLDAGTAGPCNMKEGRPGLIKNKYPATQVTFSNVKWGEINSTYSNAT